MLRVGVEQPSSEEVQGLLGVVRALHVQPDKAMQLLCPVQDLLHVPVAEVFRDVETHLSQLDRDVDLLSGLGQAVQHLEVLVPRGDSLGLDGDALAQEIERSGDPSLGQLARRLHCLIDSLTGYKSRSKLPG